MARTVKARFTNIALPDGQVLLKVGDQAVVSNSVFAALNTAGVVGTSGAKLVSDEGAAAGTLQDDDAVNLQAAVVAAPAALTSVVAAGGTPTKAEYDALRVDVTNLRTTLSAVLTALKGTGKPMSAT